MRECEERFESFIDLSSEGYWEQDENYRFTLITSGTLGRSGIDPKTYLGTTRWDHGAVPVGDGGNWEKHKALLDARQPFSDFLMRRADAKGEVRYISASGQPVFDDQGRFRGYRGITKDITGEKREELLLRLEHSVTRSLAEADSASQGVKAAMRAICETQAWECGRYFAVDEAAGVLRCAEGWSVPDPKIESFVESSRALVLRPGEALAGRVWESAQPLWVPDITNDARAMRRAMQIGVRGTFVFPITSGDKVIGVLAFNSREVREPDGRLLQAVRVIGSQVGQFLQRKQAEEVLRDSEERFRSLAQLSSDVYWEQDKQFRFTSMAGIGSERLNVRSLHLIGKKRWEYDYLNIAGDGWAEHIATLESHKPFYDLELCRFDETGRPVWVSISGEPVFDRSGVFKGYRGLGKDITERKREEQLLNLEHTVTRCLAEADSASGALKSVIRAICESQGWECGRYFYADEKAGLLRFGEAWGVPEAAIERYLAGSLDYTSPLNSGSKARVWRTGEPLWNSELSRHGHLVQSTLGSARDSFVFAVPSGGKTLGVLSFTSRKLREPDDRLLRAVRVIGSQIGQFLQRKQAEEVTRESEERFRSLTQLSSDVYWEQDEQFRFISFKGVGSDRVSAKNLPYIGKKRWEQNYVNMTADAWAEHIALLEAHKPFRDMELCRVDERGRKTWISISGEPVFDAAGVFKGYRGVGKDITERKIDEEQIQFLANHDALTALPNRAMFTEVLNLAIQNARRYHRNFAVLFIDLDRFKIINDTLGHEAGDKLLQEMGKRLTHTVRASDVVARLGGDEFVVLVQEVSEPKQVATVARKILAALVQPMTMQGQECRVTASVGICMFPTDAPDEQALMKNADIAMYRAKEDGKNNYKFYSEEINVHSFERLALETSLRRGLERNEFLLHYQAKLDLHTGGITGVEALVRWMHPELGMVPPGQFIPLAEETGLIVPIGRWVLNTACAQTVAWLRQGLPRMRMAVNLSARQFADDNLLEDITQALKAAGIDPDLLELELTESMVMQNTERAGRVLAEIKRLGVRLAIDDFGVGYSSLSHLKRFPIDTLKVDRSFIRDIPQDPEDKAITEAIIAMGKSLSLTVVAEGVETLEQQEFLREHACDEMQGFYFSKPIPPEQFAELLRKRLER